MPIHVEDVSTLQTYLSGVVQKAGHHAENVRYVAVALVGAIVLFKDADREIKVFTREGEMANVMWVHIHGSQYVFSYEHKSQSIVLKRGNTQGEVVVHFTNATTIPDILHTFEGL